MPTRNLSVSLKPNPRADFTAMFEEDLFTVLREQPETANEITTGLPHKGPSEQRRTFARKCWLRMRQMKAEFEQSNVPTVALYGRIS